MYNYLYGTPFHYTFLDRFCDQIIHIIHISCIIATFNMKIISKKKEEGKTYISRNRIKHYVHITIYKNVLFSCVFDKFWNILRYCNIYFCSKFLKILKNIIINIKKIYTHTFKINKNSFIIISNYCSSTK